MRIAAAVLAGFFILAVPALADTYKKSIDLPPMKLTYDDLNKVMIALRVQLKTNSTSPDGSQPDESVTVSDGAVTLQKTGASTFGGADRVPDVATELKYYYRNPSGPIEEIWMAFRDLSRTITIAGLMPDQVDAVEALLRQKFSEKSIIMGGDQFRMLGAIMLMAISGALWNIPLWWKKASVVLRVALIAAGIGLYLCILILPFDRWFPGFAIYAGPTSFMVRYSAEITFAGLVLSIVFFVASIFIANWFSRRNQAKVENN